MSRPRQPPGPSADAQLLDGLVVGSHGRHCVVETPAGERVICHPRGKKLAVVVGDGVRWRPSHDEGTVEQITPRRNLLYRQDAVRTKSFAANLDQVLILVAAEPEFSEHQLARALIACEAAHIEPLIALNKADLAEPFARAWQRLAPYRAMGYAVLPLAAKPRGPAPAQADTLAALGQRLHRRTTLILGPSGAGKSTLINRLIPGAAAQTGEISQALNSGKHTTTTTTWYWLDDQRETALLDSPGFQEFGLKQVPAADLAAYMPDLAAEIPNCRFNNCSHLHEPDCGVQAAVDEGRIAASRYRIYRELYEELSAKRW
jgi:ribosome biogenesis GTPase